MNPEWRRNVRLELTPQRLVATPVLILLLAAFASARDAHPWPTVFTTAVTIFILLVHFWGTRKASESIGEEVRDRTWDWQRLSSLHPWEMGLGKLFGATALTWYGGLVCVALMAIAAWADPHRSGTGVLIVVLVASAIMLHGVALAGSLQASRKDSKLGSRIATIMLIPLALIVTAAYLRGGADLGTVAWHDRPFRGMTFVAASTCLFAAWAVLAVYREMSRELKVARLPWAYPAFIFFAGAYASGFVPSHVSPRTSSLVFFVFLVAVALTYYGIFADVTSALSIRRLVLRIRHREWRRALETVPLWASALAIALLFAVASSFVVVPFGERHGRAWLGMPPIAMAFFALRDAGLLVFFALSPRARRPEGSTLLAIAVLSWLLPGLLALMGLAAGAHALAPYSLRPWQATGIAAIHVAVVFALVAWRWRRLERTIEASRGAEGRGV